MSPKFTPKEFKSILEKATGKTYVPSKVKKALKEAGMSKQLYRSTSKSQALKTLKTLKEKGVISIYKRPAEIVRAIERKMAREVKVEKKPENKMTVSEMRKKMEEEKEKKEKMRKMMAEIYQRERTREAEKSKAEPGEPTPTTSALRPASKKPPEEKPKVLDLPID